MSEDDGDQDVTTGAPNQLDGESDAQLYAPDEYEVYYPPWRDRPHLQDVDAVHEFLTGRCCVTVSRATVRSMLAGDHLTLEFDEASLAGWARERVGGWVYPTLQPAKPAADQRPPRVLFVSNPHYDTDCLRDQLQQYGADVVHVEIFSPDQPALYADRRTASNGEAAALAGMLSFDAAFIDASNEDVLRIVLEILHERGVPSIVVAHDLPALAARVPNSAAVLTERVNVADIPRLLAEHLPSKVRERLDLSRPMIDEWYDGYVDFLSANAYAEAIRSNEATTAGTDDKSAPSATMPRSSLRSTDRGNGE